MRTQERAGALKKLYKLCYRHQDVPGSAKIVDCYNESTTFPVYDSDTTAVFKGTYLGRPVAVKILQSYVSDRQVTLMVRSIVVLDYTGDSSLHAIQKFCKEAVIWRHLRHPNILPLVGVTINPELCSLVSDWMDNGTINSFTKMNPDANRIDLVGSHVILVSQRLI